MEGSSLEAVERGGVGGWVGESLKGFRHGNRLSHDDTAALYPPRARLAFFFYGEAARIEQSWESTRLRGASASRCVRRGTQARRRPPVGWWEV